MAILAAWVLVVAGPAGAEDDVRALAAKLNDPSPAVRIAAAAALRDRSPDVKEVLPQLADALRNEYFDVRMAAAEALRKVGPGAVGVLTEALAKDDYWSRDVAAMTLGRIGPAAAKAAPALGKALKYSSADVRGRAAAALARIGAVRGALANLAAMLTEPRAGVREAACEALARGGLDAARLVVPLLDHADGEVRGSAAETLGRIGPDAAPMAVPALLGALRAEIAETNKLYGAIDNEGIRRSRMGHAAGDSPVVAALGRMGPMAAAAVASLFDSADETTLRFALTVLGRLGAEAAPASDVVLELFRSKTEPWMRAQAAWVLGAVAGANPKALPALREALNDAAEPVRRNSAYVLAGAGPQGRAALAAALKSDSAACCLAAVQGLARAAAQSDAAAALAEAARDADPAVRDAAANALGSTRK